MTPQPCILGQLAVKVKRTEQSFKLPQMQERKSLQFESSKVNCLLKQKYQYSLEEWNRIQNFHNIIFQNPQDTIHNYSIGSRKEPKKV